MQLLVCWWYIVLKMLIFKALPMGSRGYSYFRYNFLHYWKENILLSIGGGTVLYMVLVQAVFI